MNELIKKFNNIRDIPYSIPLSINEELENDKCCSWKAKMLKKILETNWYNVNYRICKFKWSDMNLPEKVIKVSHEDDSTHVYLEVEMNWKIINLDSTWDRWLKSILEISEWDWENSTSIAVKQLWLLSVQKSNEIMTQSIEESTIEDLKINWKFYKALNEYFEEVRSYNI